MITRYVRSRLQNWLRAAPTKRIEWRRRFALEFLEDRLAPATLLHSLFPPDGVASQTNGQFGRATAVDSSFCVVGMPLANIGGVQGCGAAFVYSTTTGALIATLANPSPDRLDRFGDSVSVSGNTVVVGARLDDTGGTDSGQAYVFNATTGALIATLENPSSATGGMYPGHFGVSVSVSGNTVVVGAEFDDAGAADSGQAYVFNATTGALIATLINPSPAALSYFGQSVSVSGSTVVVGSPRPTEIGEAYVFNAMTGALIATLDNPAHAESDTFGYSVSISGNTVVVGAPYDDTRGFDSGQAYVFNATTGALIATLNNPAPARVHRFGYSVSVSENTIVVGPEFDDAGAANSGQAYVFNATTGALIATLANPTPADEDQFGFSVSVSGNRAVVGADFDDTQNVNQGAAYVYSLDSGAVSPPVVTSVAPFVGPTTGGITVVINGAHFLGVTGPAGVNFGANNATSYTVDSDARITAVVPPGNAGTVNVTVTNAAGTSSTAGAADDFQYTAAAAPQLLSVTPNGNIASLAGNQRSRVASLVVAFDQPIQLDPNALTLALHTNNVSLGGVPQSAGFGSLPTSLSFSTSDNITWIVTFVGNTDAGVDGSNSLKDGVYDLNIDAAKVHPLGAPGVTMAANRTTTFHRLFGDTNAAATPTGGTPGTDFEAVVNTADNLAFRRSFNNPATYKAFLDFNGDGVIDANDNLQFRNRFNKSLTWST